MRSKHASSSTSSQGKGRVQLTEEQLLRHLRQYETLLKSYGAKIEDLEKLDDKGTKSYSSSIEPNGLENPRNTVTFNECKQSLQDSKSEAPVQ